MELAEDIKSIEDVNVRGKTILLRVDLNSSVKDGKLLHSPKVAEHFRTIKELLDAGAKVVILSHQGREGREDFIDLKQHRDKLQEMLGESIGFYSWNDHYTKAIKELKEGKALILDNTRFLGFEAINKSPEEHAKEPIIKKLAELADYYVLDALSVAHRSHATVVGFIPLLPSFAGPVLMSELRALERVKRMKDNSVLILGGMKPEDSLFVMEKMLKERKVSRVLLGGALGELAIMAKGAKLGIKEKFLKEKGLLEFVPKVKQLLSKFKARIVFPADLAIRRNGLREEISLAELPVNDMIFDIGEITVNTYESIIEKAELIIYNGPVGRFESYQFAFGTRKIFDALVRVRGFTLIGGGDTVTAMIRLGFKSTEFGHVSLAGKALLMFLTGEELPALTALANAKIKK